MLQDTPLQLPPVDRLERLSGLLRMQARALQRRVDPLVRTLEVLVQALGMLMQALDVKIVDAWRAGGAGESAPCSSPRSIVQLSPSASSA